MPQNIGPQLHFARPSTHAGFSTSHTRARPKSRAQTSSASGVRKTPEENGDYHIELLEYEWPDLPPIIDMKDAVTRRRVSKGINYLLPVDKGRNSIDNKFRTDLRAMFQEPYSTEGSNYDDNRVVQSAKIHFRTNAVDTKWSMKQIRTIPVYLNSESENVRKMYAHSAPAGGRTRSGMSSEKLKTRSSLFLPVKAKAHPEAQRLRKEVENIIKSVQEDNDEYDSDAEGKTESPSHTGDKVNSKVDNAATTTEKRTSILKFREQSITEMQGVLHENEKNSKLTAEQFETYDQLKNSKPPKALIPDQFRSEYLSPERNQEIWDWLHYGESITDFQYFLSICG